jgi:hypothetical protein
MKPPEELRMTMRSCDDLVPVGRRERLRGGRFDLGLVGGHKLGAERILAVALLESLDTLTQRPEKRSASAIGMTRARRLLRV